MEHQGHWQRSEESVLFARHTTVRYCFRKQLLNYNDLVRVLADANFQKPHLYHSQGYHARTRSPSFMLYHTIQGHAVPALGLGTFGLRGTDCRDAVAHALSLGYRHVDTAQMYDNEADVGRGLRAADVARDDVFLTTKVWWTNLAPADVCRSTEESLRRLGTAYVDLLLVHWPNPDVPVERTLDALLALQEAGKTRHVGVSNFPPALLRRALAHTPLFCNQVEYHPFLSQDALLDLAGQHDLLLTAYSPIAKGRVLQDPVLQAIGATHGKTPVQVTLRWLVQQDGVAAIPKAAGAGHRAANCAIFDFELSTDEMDRIAGRARDLRLVSPSFAPDWSQG